MPKRSIEINKFIQGIISTPSNTDTDINSAKYSKNIDPATAQGRLQGIDGDKKLTTVGFKDEEGTYSAISVDSSDLSIMSDKKDIDKASLISIKTDSRDIVDSINYIDNIHGNQVVQQSELSNSIPSTKGGYNMTNGDDKIFIGLGGASDAKSKVVMKTTEGGFTSSDNNILDIFDTELYPPNLEAFAGDFAEFMTFPIHGNSANTLASTDNEYLSWDDETTPAGKIRADYDMELNNSSDRTGNNNTLHYHINNAAGELYGLQIGQIFKISNSGTSNDFDDNALEQWKEYDYDKNVSGVVAHDLFMYCGESDNGAPVLRYVGNANTQKPAFAYAFKDNSSKIFKISLTTETDANAFGAGNITIARSATAGDTISIARQTQRITELDLTDIDGFSGNYVTAITPCHSPTLWNSMGLAGQGVNPHTADSAVYYNNGHIKYLYRHGVLYVASHNKREVLYRLNIIDFHQITGMDVMIDDIRLDFTMIPSQLHAENGDGIVRRTIEDQLLETGEFDPKTNDASWNRIPNDAYIVGLCETFENGVISSVNDTNKDRWSGHQAYTMLTSLDSRLTSGDKVRFAGLSINTSDSGAGTKNKAFNTNAPYTINAKNNGESFIIDSGSASRVPNLDSDYTAHWWNAKLWVLYARKNTSSSFDKWDMFLYNANTLDMDSDRAIKMADRTPPYSQVRYYECERHDGSIGKLYYPGQFAFIKKEAWINQPEGTNHLSNGLLTSDIASPKGNVTTVSSAETFGYNQFGIYDKSGRWSSNGLDYQKTHEMGRPRGWNGGSEGPPCRTFRLENQVYNWEGGLEASNIVDPGSSDAGNMRYGAGGPGLTGDLMFGHNMGWSIDNERKVRPTRNSLHPLVPYSTLYMGSQIYSWINSKDIPDWSGGMFHWEGPPPLPISKLPISNNRPRHAVTFIGKVHGDFVVQPDVITRAERTSNITHTPGGTEYNVFNPAHNQLKEFRLWDYGNETIKKYRDDHCLFTIDDFSGHRGSVVSDNTVAANDTDATSRLSGIEIGRPNWGGPEIENPLYKADGKYGEDVDFLYSSVNGGFFESDGDDNDKGWDGYAPPRLFSPGNGYYVYINRTWHGHAEYNEQMHNQLIPNIHPVGGVQETGTSTIGGENTRTFVWGFQVAGKKPGVTTSTIGGWDSNRWYNFSTTAIGSRYGELNVSSADWGNLSDTSASLKQNKFSYRDSSGVLQGTFDDWPLYAHTTCTMQAIQLNTLQKINNIFPFIMGTSWHDLPDEEPYNTDFYTGYMIGYKTVSNTSGVLILRTNFDNQYSVIWNPHTESHLHNTPGNLTNQRIVNVGKMDYYDFDNLNTDGSETANMLFDTNPNVNMNIPFYTASNHWLEVADLESDTGIFQGATFANEEYGGSIIGDRLKVFPQTPWQNIDDTGTDDQDWWVYVNSGDGTKNYFGKENDRFDPEYSYVGGTGYGLYPSGGTFDGDANIFTGAQSTDATILTETTNFVSFSNSTESAGSVLSAGSYYYKFTFEYDNQYESALTDGAPLSHVLTASGEGTWDYIKLTFNLPEGVVSNLSSRLTGIGVYRKFGGGDEDNYSLVELVKFTDGWATSNGNKIRVVTDDGNLGWSYESITGLPQTLNNTSLNYGLSTRYQGYMFVSQAWHPDMEDVHHYIFRSLPDNFFAFNWANDFLIMPETPIAMTSFNSRLFVWGKNKLYKIDPLNMVIEDEYEGVSIASKYSFCITEYGLCFLDENNIYLHDGNQAKPIGGDILYSSNESITYSGSSYSREKQGYRELFQDTLAAGYKPRVVYSGIKNSFVVLLYSTSGIALSYNLDLKRWDLWDAPTPSAVTYSKNGHILINDGSNLYQYLSNTSSEDYTDYNQQEWDWFSNDITFGSDTQEKVFKKISFTGSPCIYDFASSTPAVYDSTSDTKTLSVQAFVDDKAVALTVQNKFYDTMRYGNIKTSGIFSETMALQNEQGGLATYEGNLVILSEIAPSTSNAMEFLRPGQLIKINDEIMLIRSSTTNTNVSPNRTEFTVFRGLMGTTKAEHASGSEVYIIAPKLSFPGGTKGNRLKLQIQKQRGYIDSIQISYKPKSIK